MDWSITVTEDELMLFSVAFAISKTSLRPSGRNTE